MWRRWGFIRQGKLQLLRLLRLRAQPEEIARGFALGIFIGMTPTMGGQMLIAVFFALILRQNKIAAAIAVWISNPVTAPFIYGVEYEVGRLLLGVERVAFPQHLTSDVLTKFGYDLLVPLWSGSILFGVLLAPVSYALVVRLLPNLRTLRITRWPRRQQNGK